MADLRVVSIGALAAHPLWGEREAVRSGHSTTTLIRAGDRTIVVDPGLPDQILAARLAERAGITPGDVTDVFLTCFRPDCRRGLGLFEQASWWISEREREAVGVPLAEGLKLAAERGQDELGETLRGDVVLLSRCKAAPDRLAEGVDLFPLPGVTPGLTGLLLGEPRHTTLVCGDAVATCEHLEQGRVLATAADVELAGESMVEALEIADLLVLGRDNLVVNPRKTPF